jgi:16S rRNA (adenine1518-N6/adenine1519-N6)-dimethyltransferase
LFAFPACNSGQFAFSVIEAAQYLKMPEYQQRPKLGQNFLTNLTAQADIVDALGDLSQRTVVEIGPGAGAITSLLAARAQRLIAIELDRDLVPQLREQFADRPSVEILEQDVLTIDFAELREKARDSNAINPDDKLLVVGNLPFYITSDILMHLFRFTDVIERAVLMVQREVADRIAAHPGSSDYGILSVTTQMYTRTEKLFTLPPTAFTPMPQVHSTVVRLIMTPRFDELRVAPDAFLAFVRTCYAQKRKMLVRNLRNADFDPDAIANSFESFEISPLVRAEELDLAKMASLFRSLTERRR